MKRLITILALALLCFGAKAQNDTLRILSIGNSFSNDALHENFGEICAAAGKHVCVGILYIGGCSLERHIKSLKEEIPDYTYHKRIDGNKMVSLPKQVFTKGIFDEPWDIVTFQQASRVSGSFDTFEPYLGELVAYVKENIPTAKRLMWHQTWAYTDGCPGPVMTKTYKGQKGMYEAICEASKTACDKYGLEIIPSGTAVQNLRTSFDRDQCNRDGSHLSYTVGRYLAACTWFEAIFKESVVGNSFKPVHLLEYRREVAQNAAHLAVANPLALTNMKKLGFEVKPANQDESKVPSYTLPDPLVMNDGRPVKGKAMWEGERRPEIYSMFESEVFGKAPGAPEKVRYEVLEENDKALDGMATRRQVRIWLAGKSKAKWTKNAYIDLLLYIPNSVKKAPAFLGINFKGNFAISDDPAIIAPKFDKAKYGKMDNFERGAASSRWPVEEIVKAGYAVATFYRGDASPDFDNSFNLGVHSYMANGKRTYPKPDEWGVVAAWAWSLSRALDYLETDARIDATKVAVIGHSRLGKTALWAGASDPRFAMVISNCSGCTGAALSRRAFGETVEAINMHFPHWFCDNYKKYNGRENKLPIDQHELLALIAPRPLYVTSASKDQWADPTGEGLSLEEAAKVYKAVYGAKASKKLGRHIREGKHDITLYDWQNYIKFADKWLKK